MGVIFELKPTCSEIALNTVLLQPPKLQIYLIPEKPNKMIYPVQCKRKLDKLSKSIRLKRYIIAIT